MDPLTETSRFPMQDGPSIDMVAAREIYRMYVCLYGTAQSLARIAERGGFGWGEIPLFLEKLTIARKALQGPQHRNYYKCGGCGNCVDVTVERGKCEECGAHQWIPCTT